VSEFQQGRAMDVNKKIGGIGIWSATAVAALLLAAEPASAGTITVTASTPNNWDYVNIVDKRATIDGASGPGSSTQEATVAIQLQATALGTLNAYCTDLFDYINIPSTDTFNQSTLSQGQTFATGSSGGTTVYGGTWSVNQVKFLNALLSNTTTQTSPVQTAALQVAIWEVEYGNMTNNAYNLTGTSQDFYFIPASGNADSNSSTVLSYAQTYLNDVTGYFNAQSQWIGPTWSQNSANVVEYLTASGVQSLVYLASAPSAPEPSSLAVFGLGLAGVWRARLRKRS
jgi:hypothetical protein